MSDQDQRGDAMDAANEWPVELEHACFLSKAIETLFLNERGSDMVLTVENQPFCVHKNILAARSQFFDALFYGRMKESNESRVNLQETPLEAFQLVLKFAYSSKIDLKNLKEETILETLELAHRFVFKDLEEGICNYIKTIISAANVYVILDHAVRLQMAIVKNDCLIFAEKNGREFLENESLLNLSAAALIEIVAHDSYYDDEINMFRAVRKWIERNKPENVEDILRHIRLPLIQQTYLVTEVRASNLFSDSVILSAIDTIIHEKYDEINCRKVVVVKENLASPAFGAEVICGEGRYGVLCNNDDDTDCTWHPINGSDGIVFDIKKPYIINSIKMRIFDMYESAVSYYVEVSVNNSTWFRVIDNRNKTYQSWQELSFPKTFARYIKIVGTYDNTAFCIESFECSFND